MPEITIQIIRFVDERFPGFVEGHFVDATGREHVFIEKAPVVSAEVLTADSHYPRFGVIRCEIEEEWQDANGRPLMTISTERPDGVESVGGQTRFVALSSQIKR